MLVSSPMTSGTPCLAASAARYFLLMSPNGCSTKLTLTPGCDCSNSGMTVSMETLSKYQTVSSVVAAVLVLDVPVSAGTGSLETVGLVGAGSVLAGVPGV